MEVLERVFRSFGFVPIDTPALEFAEVLLGKGGGETDKQVYRFKDNGDRDVALRFDLTVPFARFMAEHVDELYLPFRRYHMAKVWRGENTQRGRYREFMQCDFDIVGTDSASADTDIVLLIGDAIGALDVGGFTIRAEPPRVFNRFLGATGVREKSVPLLRLVDKAEKIGADELERQLAVEVGDRIAAKVLRFIAKEPSFEATLEKLEELAGGPAEDTGRLRDIWRNARESGFIGTLVLDPSITRWSRLLHGRGLRDEPRRDARNRLRLFRRPLRRTRQPLHREAPAGSRIVDRPGPPPRCARCPGQVKRRAGYTEVLVLDLDETLAPSYHRVARALRAGGIAAEVFPEKKKLAQQFAYAERKGIGLAVMIGAEEAQKGEAQLRDLASRESSTLPFVRGDAAPIVARASELLARPRP